MGSGRRRSDGGFRRRSDISFRIMCRTCIVAPLFISHMSHIGSVYLSLDLLISLYSLISLSLSLSLSLFASSVAHLVAHIFNSDLSHISVAHRIVVSLSRISLSLSLSLSLLCAGALRSLRCGVWLSDSLPLLRGRRGVSFATSHHPMAQPKARLIRQGAGAGTKFEV